jgi:DNA-binding beta-propeller fold protein YncE
MPARGRLSLAVLAALLGSGCGAKFPLPTEIAKGRAVPSDKSYQMLATWTGMNGVADILLTQGTGSQLFILFNHGVGADPTAARGEVRAYPLTRPTPIPEIVFPTRIGGTTENLLFNPVALSAGAKKIFVLDQGDTCLARADTLAPYGCGDRPGWTHRVTNLKLYWRVREYGLLGGDTLSTFSDTTMAFVQGIAADSRGGVYVSGTAIVRVQSQTLFGAFERSFQFRVYRYERGPRYPGVVPADRNLPGANWHRDTTFVIEEGTGIGSLFDPRGLAWGAYGGSALYAADFGKNWVQKLYDDQVSTGYYYLDGGQSGTAFNGPTDVAVDLLGYVYIADTGNQRVLRYAPDASYVQRVDVETNASGQPLRNPVAVAVDDSLAYVGDADAAEVIRYKRRP